MGLIKDLKVETMTTLLVEAMPASLSLASPAPLSGDDQRDKYRAATVKERINA
jgi:protein-arginine kinase